jgi:hypothetical protein
MPKRRPEPELVNLDDFGLNLAQEPDRACVILAVSLLDSKLASALLGNMLDADDLVHGNNAPLGTFSARIDAARALGIISADAAADLHVLRRVRSDFAHSFDPALSFTEQALSDRCMSLRTSESYVAGFDEAARSPTRRYTSALVDTIKRAHLPPRTRFELALDFLAQYLDELPRVLPVYKGCDLLADVHALSARSADRPG